MDKKDQMRKPGWLREAMPKVARMIDERRTQWGATHANACISGGMAGQPNRFYAFENGYVVGTAFTPDASPVKDVDLLRVAMLDGSAYLAMAAPEGSARGKN